MQLAILVAILLLAGQNNFSQIKPLIEQFGGEEGKAAIKQAEELNQMISAVQTFASAQGESKERSAAAEQDLNFGQSDKTGQTPAVCHPLDPVKSIADDKILSALSRYVAVGD